MSLLPLPSAASVLASLLLLLSIICAHATAAHYVHTTVPIPQWQPRQVHIAYGHNSSEMVVTWSTVSHTNDSIVEWGTDMFDLKVSTAGESVVFVDGTNVSTQWVHRVHLHHLPPNTSYFYHVGCHSGWSPVFGFKTVPKGTQGWPLRLAVYGDLGTTNAHSLTRLQEESHQGMYDAVLHVGDFAYDMYMNNGSMGDIFMDQIEPIAAYLPYMTCPGNHENQYDFLQYRSRFSMPDYSRTESLYYSFDLGPVHFVAVSSEVYYYGPDIEGRTKAQYEWIERDLKFANSATARAERPWIVLFGHRPMYCSSNNTHDCVNADCITRVGLPETHQYGLETLLYEYGVDLAVWAHEHHYERTYPMYNYTVMNGSEDEPYTNPKAPVHITTGSAGCYEKLAFFNNAKPYWSAVRVLDYGYTRLTVHNDTHMHWEQVSDDQDGLLTDSIWLVQQHHGSFSNDGDML